MGMYQSSKGILILLLIFVSISNIDAQNSGKFDSELWKEDTSGLTGYRYSVMDSINYEKLIGLTRADIIQQFGYPNFLCLQNDSTYNYIYILEISKSKDFLAKNFNCSMLPELYQLFLIVRNDNLVNYLILTP